MEVYSIAAPADKIEPARAPRRAWTIDQRLAQTFWRNPNARGIAEPDPRTVARGRRPRRALRAPAPHSRRRLKRQRQIQTARPQVPLLIKKLDWLALHWPEPARLFAASRELAAAWGDGSWLIDDPEWKAGAGDGRSQSYIPRAAWSDGARFMSAYRAAQRLVWHVERMRERETRDRLRALLPDLRPSAPPVENRSPRSPEGRQYIDLGANFAAPSEEASSLGPGAEWFTSRPLPRNVT